MVTRKGELNLESHQYYFSEFVTEIFHNAVHVLYTFSAPVLLNQYPGAQSYRSQCQTTVVMTTIFSI